jgi:hypothetical protein
MAAAQVKPDGKDGPAGIRRSYTTPRLIEFGDVSRLVEGGGSVPVADGRSGMSRMERLSPFDFDEG